MKQRLLILVCSPKRRGGASGFFARLLRLFLPGRGVVCLPLRSRADFPAALDALKEAGALCFSLPLYTVWRRRWWFAPRAGSMSVICSWRTV